MYLFDTYCYQKHVVISTLTAHLPSLVKRQLKLNVDVNLCILIHKFVHVWYLLLEYSLPISAKVIFSAPMKSAFVGSHVVYVVNLLGEDPRALRVCEQAIFKIVTDYRRRSDFQFVPCGAVHSQNHRLWYWPVLSTPAGWQPDAPNAKALRCTSSCDTHVLVPKELFATITLAFLKFREKDAFRHPLVTHYLLRILNNKSSFWLTTCNETTKYTAIEIFIIGISVHFTKFRVHY